MANETMARTGQTDETDRLISSQKVDGTAVYSRNGDSLGTVDHLMIDKFSGQVEYAVMSCGGFLGMGESYNPVPWKSLTYDTNLGGYVMDRSCPARTVTAVPVLLPVELVGSGLHRAGG